MGKERGRLETLDAYKDWTNEERGVEASLAISYRLLDTQQQRRWRALAVFPGDLDAAAAGSVWNVAGEKDAARSLGDLYAASMAGTPPAVGTRKLGDVR